MSVVIKRKQTFPMIFATLLIKVGMFPLFISHGKFHLKLLSWKTLVNFILTFGITAVFFYISIVFLETPMHNFEEMNIVYDISILFSLRYGPFTRSIWAIAEWKTLLPQIFGAFKYLNNLARMIVAVIFIF